MPRSEEANARIREEQRKRLMDAAIRVFARKGLAAAKMAEIAAEAGVSYGLAYHYFESKDALFGALLEWAFSSVERLYADASARPGTPWDRIEWLVTRMIEGLPEYPEAALMVLQAVASEATPSYIREVVDKGTVTMQAQLTRLIREGQEAGQVVEGDPEQLQVLLNACIQGLSIAAAFPQETPHGLPSVAMVLRMLRA